MSEEQLTLDDVFTGAEQAEEADEVAEAGEVETTEEDEKSEPAEEAKEESTPDSKEAQESKSDEDADWKFAAYKDEKGKRQALEKENAELRAQLEPKKEEKAPDVLDDPEGYQQFQMSQVDQKITNAKVEQSQFFAEREFGKDKVDQAFQKFSEMVSDNPALYQQALNAVSPYHEIISVVEKAEKLEAMQDVDAYEDKLRAEIEAKVREEYESKQAKSNAKKSSVTPSLNSNRSADAGSKDPDSDQSLEELFKR